jgi:superfamily II DNA or RNA helicase
MNKICRQGYYINKSNLKGNELEELKTLLTVKPYVNEDYGPEAESYNQYAENDTHIIVPKYIGFKKFGLLDYEKEPVKTNIKFNGELRDYQKVIASTCNEKIVSEKKGGGIISIPCGYGKTVIALYLACLLGVKTLVVTHKSFLLNQWVLRAEEFCNARIGIIRQNKIDVKDKDIVIGMLQSIAMKDYDDSVFEGFGLVIFDECHHTPSRIFSKCLGKTSFKYTIGLSATPRRADGLTKVMNWYLGDLLYKMEKKSDNNVYVKAFQYTSDDKKYFVEKTTWFKGRNRPSIPKMVTNICKIDGRNKFIGEMIDSLISLPGRKVLILSHRLEHLEILKQNADATIKLKVDAGILEEGEVTTSKYIGGMKESVQALAAQADIIFASYTLAEEGLDIDGLNTLILATPKVNIVQSIGRIMRKPIKEGDVYPLIIDIIDEFSMFPTWGKKRIDYYEGKKYKVNKYKCLNDKCISLKEYLCNKKIIKEEDIADEESDLPYQYIKNTESEYAYALLAQKGTLNEYWADINYKADLQSIFTLKYEWELNCMKEEKVKDSKNDSCEELSEEEDILSHRIKVPCKKEAIRDDKVKKEVIKKPTKKLIKKNSKKTSAALIKKPAKKLIKKSSKKMSSVPIKENTKKSSNQLIKKPIKKYNKKASNKPIKEQT